MIWPGPVSLKCMKQAKLLKMACSLMWYIHHLVSVSLRFAAIGSMGGSSFTSVYESTEFEKQSSSDSEYNGVWLLKRSQESSSTNGKNFLDVQVEVCVLVVCD